MFKYQLDERPPFLEMVVFGLQWLAILMPITIILGKVAAFVNYNNTASQVIYLQKLFFICGLALLLQILAGHRLTLVLGPAAVLLIGVVVSQGRSMEVIYTSITLGGVFLCLLSLSGFLKTLIKLFTPRVTSVVLILIAFTLAPTIINLVLGGKSPSPFYRLVFFLIFVAIVFWANRRLDGIWKATLIIWAMICGTLIYLLLFGQSSISDYKDISLIGHFFRDVNFKLKLDVGVLISFIICYLALMVNDLGSIYSVGSLFKVVDLERRTEGAVLITGISNVLAGMLGVIGPVNYSLSSGIILSNGCASRFTLIPTAIFLMGLSFFPASIAFLGSIPSVIVGGILLFIVCSQIGAGLILIFDTPGGFKFEHGLIIGLPLMLGIIVTFLPPEAQETIPSLLRPILGNGFIIGTLGVTIMEHGIYKGIT